jgi:murein DD-endopeptidase MepM/ murein hydrolase activator NlpD
MPQPTERRSFALSRRSRTPWIVGLLVVTLATALSGGTRPVAADELSDARAKREALEDRIAAQKRQVAKLDKLQGELKTDIGATKAALRSINADLASVRKQVSKIEATVATVQLEYDRLAAELASLDIELARLRDEQERKRAELTDRLDRLAQRIREAYDTDRTSMLEIFLSAGSFTDLMTQVSYSLDVAEQDQMLAEQIERDRETLAALETSVQTTRDQTDDLRKETAAQKRELDRRLAELKAAQETLRDLERQTERELAKQRAAYAKLAENESALRESMAANAAAQKRLQRRIDALIREQQQRGNIPSVYNGTFIWPHAGRITQEFGCTGFAWEPPLGDCPNFHRGIDIAAPRWTPVRAAADGVVVFAGPNPYDPAPKAWIVIIAHSASLRTWYAHVDNERPPTVRAGRSVKQGQVIAYVGSTGRSTGYHTDWRVELRGEWVNGRRFL